jgi:hypothetical protein
MAQVEAGDASGRYRTGAEWIGLTQQTEKDGEDEASSTLTPFPSDS